MAMFETVNGRSVSSRSITGSGGVVAEDMLGPEVTYRLYRLGGTKYIAVGCAVAMDAAGEVQQGITTYAAGNLLTASTTTTAADFWGRQVIYTTGAVATNTSYNLFAGVYSGKGGSYAGFNMGGVTCTGTSISPNNALTWVTSTATAVPGNAAAPGDAILVVTHGCAAAWVCTANATAVGESVCNIGTVAPADGVMSKTLPANVVGFPRATNLETTPIAYAAAGTGMGCRVWVAVP